MQNISSLFSLKNFLILGSLVALMCLLNAGYCADTSSGDMPWDSIVTKVRKSIAGPVAMAVAIIGIVGSGAMLALQGGEMNQVVKTLLIIAIVVAVVVLANKVVSSLTGESAILEADLNVMSHQIQNVPMVGNNISQLVHFSGK